MHILFELYYNRNDELVFHMDLGSLLWKVSLFEGYILDYALVVQVALDDLVVLGTFADLVWVNLHTPGYGIVLALLSGHW